MKRLLIYVLCIALLLCTLSGCGKKPSSSNEPAPPSAPSSAPEETSPQSLHLDALTLEIPRDYAAEDAALLSAAVQLPKLLIPALADAGAEVDAVTVTVGASASATCQALSRGTVSLAFLPAENYLEAGGGSTVILADAGESGSAGNWLEALPGRSVQLCAGPSAYGRSLTKRAQSGNPLTWTELDHARWGVLEAGSDLGWRYPSLWLSDHYDGLILEDLRQVTVYQSFDALLRAAAQEEIDLFPMPTTTLTEQASAWTLEANRTDEAGHSGFGRELPMKEEITALASTERIPSSLAVVQQTDVLTGDAFVSALAQALNTLSQTDEGRQMLSVLGAAHYVPADDTVLEPLRRILTMEGALS